MLKSIFGRFRLRTLQKLRTIMDPVEQGEKRAAPVSDDTVSDDCKKQKVEGKLDRKRKCAILFGYNGKGYLGLQRNLGCKTIEEDLCKALLDAELISIGTLLKPIPFKYCNLDFRNPGCKTIEEDLCKALLDAELIPLEHFEYMQKMSFQRAARTDKGVSAAGNLVSLKMLMNKENLVEEINKRLPAQIRVYDCFRTTQGFNSKNHCDARTYIYILPTYAFLHKDKPLNIEYRMDADMLEKANEVLEKFRGTHNFHNYTSGITASDKSAKRYIMDFECRTPYIREGVEFCVLAVKGQSFMLHQIRKMVGTMIAVLKGYMEEEFIDRTFNHDKICLPKVPGLGLVLDKLHYPIYNKRFGADHRVIDFELIKDKTNDFKEEYIFTDIYNTEVEEYSMLKWLPELESFTFEIETETDREKNIVDEKMKQREDKYSVIEAFINEHKSSKSNKTGTSCNQSVTCDNMSNKQSSSTQPEITKQNSSVDPEQEQTEASDSDINADKEMDSVKSAVDGSSR